MSGDLTPAELLEKGAAYIEEVGLYQGDYWPSPIDHHVHMAEAASSALPVCALGSMRVVMGTDIDGDFRDARDALQKHIGGALVHHWNDTPGRTAAEVADAMRACATNLRRES